MGWFFTGYGVMAIFTIGYHGFLIQGPVRHPLRIIVTGLLWPICLPLLYWMSHHG